MTREKIVAGNWKMNTNIREGVRLAEEIRRKYYSCPTKVILCVPFTHLTEIEKITSNSDIYLGAQNCSHYPKGAYTGEISVEMLKSVPVEYTIIGHSERRMYFNETPDILKQKIDLCLSHQINPIFCCGEKIDERKALKHFDVVKSQIEKSLFHLSQDDIIHIVIAYEPVWAIGTGETATPKQAQEMHAFIRDLITEKYGQSVAESISILYGGSCKPSNAKELFSQKDVDGGLIGGASLNADDFINIVNSF
ncbi:MAG: triose-phosphate isomerase [Marinilabiliales bacterium]